MFIYLDVLYTLEYQMSFSAVLSANMLTMASYLIAIHQQNFVTVLLLVVV